MSSTLRLLPSRGLIVLARGLGACDPAAVFGGCSDDLFSRVEPTSRTLRVGESYVASASAWGCRGRKRLHDEWRYVAADLLVTRVDSLTGRVTARASGATEVVARGRVYGVTPNSSRVSVVP